MRYLSKCDINMYMNSFVIRIKIKLINDAINYYAFTDVIKITPPFIL